MKFLVRQQLEADGDVFAEHLEPLANIVADSLEEEPSGPVVWLGGCGNVDERRYYMLFEAPDEATMRAALATVPGVQDVERVMVVDRDTIGLGVLRALGQRHESRTTGPGS
ncbi:hypothetical protein [Aeromicrobium sp. CTD01-1L150]|uniref:hypothetical protein n=1 Tax=Aeromicrobium sp. CTD01-1L150 TaxID=3341830 RepID=UPI0035BEC7AA